MEPFISSLETRLKKPLPGYENLDLMKPRLSNGEDINFPYRNNAKEGAVLICFYAEKGEIFFPLIQRPDYDGVHSGQIGLPGGKKEVEDKDLIQTALRESEEEIGLNPQDVKVIGTLTNYYVGASNHNVLPVIGYVTQKPEFIPDQVEVAEVIEAPLIRLQDPVFRKEKQMNVRGTSLITPYFDIDSRVVWGATAMILSELSKILEEL